jgi:hypothetical protein
MLRRVAIVRTDVSEELSAFSIRVTRIGELGTTLAVTGSLSHFVFLRIVRRLLVTANVVPSSLIFVTLMLEALSFSETSVLTRVTRRNIPEDGILHSHRRENLKSYIALTGWALQRRRNVSPVKYELGFYILEDDILHSQCRGNFKSYSVLAVEWRDSHPGRFIPYPERAPATHWIRLAGWVSPRTGMGEMEK